ncbi:hydrolase 76 protein [Entophlyctis sp. JEL0112]|nr:hydrolase 76 protein [Entophlyctis sp. JEL0112]
MYYAYYSYTGDTQYNDFVDGQMQLAVGTDDGFLDATTALTGRWNDDIGWWALSGKTLMTAAETTPAGILAPSNVVSGYNPTYISIVNTTYYQMWQDWDSACNGGIYWARDRSSSSSNNKYYKSSITNAQHIELSARLYAFTGDSVYLSNAKQVYQWMTETVIDSSTYAVYDGIDTSTCTVSSNMYSYHSGELLAGLSSLYKTTKDTTYLDEAHKHWARINSYFTNNSVLYDPGVTESPSGYLWSVYKGIADLYSVTTDSTVQSEILAVMKASALNNFQMCNSAWYCIRDLDSSTDHTLSNGTNVRDQFETVAILNALAIITGATTATHTQAVSSSTSSTTTSSSTAANNTLLYAGIGGGVGAVVLLGIAGSVVVMRRRARKAEESQRKVSHQIYGDSVHRKDYAMQARGGGSAASVTASNNYSRGRDYQGQPQQSFSKPQNYSGQPQQNGYRENINGSSGRANGGYSGRR